MKYYDVLMTGFCCTFVTHLSTDLQKSRWRESFAGVCSLVETILLCMLPRSEYESPNE